MKAPFQMTSKWEDIEDFTNYIMPDGFYLNRNIDMNIELRVKCYKSEALKIRTGLDYLDNHVDWKNVTVNGEKMSLVKFLKKANAELHLCFQVNLSFLEATRSLKKDINSKYYDAKTQKSKINSKKAAGVAAKNAS